MPDWEALAERHEARSRKRKLMWTGGIVLAAVVLGGAVGTVVVGGMHHGPTPGPTASGSSAASPARPGPAPPRRPTRPPWPGSRSCSPTAPGSRT
ncbi:hypothetical protein GCM10025734_53350 [Kitasatospora paranensis]|uniref:hypothetical protein n=1 Tax=Kitasatospora paranensis TaxID=258053 RepID=UPI0031E6A89E